MKAKRLSLSKNQRNSAKHMQTSAFNHYQNNTAQNTTTMAGKLNVAVSSTVLPSNSSG
jgi:hypothetical protein